MLPTPLVGRLFLLGKKRVAVLLSLFSFVGAEHKASNVEWFYLHRKSLSGPGGDTDYYGLKGLAAPTPVGNGGGWYVYIMSRGLWSR